jgi:hypothetical protein
MARDSEDGLSWGAMILKSPGESCWKRDRFASQNELRSTDSIRRRFQMRYGLIISQVIRSSDRLSTSAMSPKGEKHSFWNSSTFTKPNSSQNSRTREPDYLRWYMARLNRSIFGRPMNFEPEQELKNMRETILRRPEYCQTWDLPALLDCLTMRIWAIASPSHVGSYLPHRETASVKNCSTTSDTEFIRDRYICKSQTHWNSAVWWQSGLQRIYGQIVCEFIRSPDILLPLTIAPQHYRQSSRKPAYL